MKFSHLLAAAAALAMGAALLSNAGASRQEPAPITTPTVPDDAPAATATGAGEHTSAPGAGESAHPSRAFGWPSGHPVPVVRHFDPPLQPWGRGHRGVDLAIAEASPVLAAGDGTVIYAGKFADRPLVSIEHEAGIRTTYEPVEPAVTVGQQVTRGQVVGTLAGGHCHDGDCLHWGAKRGPDGYFDPLGLLSPLVRLLE
ncbi:MAG: M23 family metallopeptidase [Actinomycetaceae bacterium]|nr:M23 family metallopeptidase [Actinomycetaceae bacterium]